MSDGMNKVYLLGNLGADPELRMLPSGTAVLKLRLATTESWLDKDKQQRQERTEWHTVTVFGKRGEALAKYLSKGQKLLVEGRIHNSSAEKDGQKRWYTEVVAQDVFFAGGGGRPPASIEALMPPAPPEPDANANLDVPF
jgi:single-strand DNA-binding protein